MPQPHVIVIGGPNGAGKSTIAPVVLRDYLAIPDFVNADQIAAGLSAFDPEGAAFEAGRIMLQRLQELAAAGKSFAFESPPVKPLLLRLFDETEGQRISR